MSATPPEALIKAGHRFEGLLSFRGEAQVDGIFRGGIVATGTLRLGETARVKARVEVDELIVAGILDGDVTARRRIELRSSARVTGELFTPRLVLEDGCVLRGRCRTTPPIGGSDPVD